MLKSRPFGLENVTNLQEIFSSAALLSVFYMNTAAVFGNCGYYTPFRAILQGFPVAVCAAVSFLPHLRLVTHD